MRNLLLMCVVILLNSCNAATNTEDMSNTQIIELVKSNNIEAVKKAIEQGSDVNTKDNENRNLLLLATLNQQTEMAKYLVEKGADVNMQAKNLDSPFLYAGASGQTELVSVYLKNGARFDLFNRYYGTALIPACERGHVETVRLLASTENFPIDHINNLGWTALLEAVILGDGSAKYQEIVQILIDHGVNKNIADKNGVTALQHAESRNQHKIVEILSKNNS